MSDRPSPSAWPESGVRPSAEPGARAGVFEDVEWPSAAHAVGDGMHHEPVAPAAPAPVAMPAAAEVDPHFRIDFDEAPPVARASTALMPLPAGGPPAPPVRPPAPAAMPRAEARRAVREKAQLLRRHKGLIAGCTLAGLLLAGLFGATRDPRYSAYSILLVTPPAQGPEATVAGGFASAPGGEQSQTLNQALILQQAPGIARGTAERLLARPDAAGLPTVRAATEAQGAPLTAEAYAQYLQDEVVTVAPAGDRVDAIRVEATTANPSEAALIATLFTDRYQALTRETNRERVGQTRDLLDEQIARRQGELDEIEQQLAAYLTRENAAGLDEQTRVTVAQIGSLQGQLDLARVNARTQAARLAQLESDLASVGGRLARSAETAVVASPVETTALDTQISDLERLIDQIYLRNPDLRANPYAHPDLRSMLTRLEGLRAERRRIASQVADAAVAAGGLDLSSQGANGAQYIASLQQQISSVRADLEGARAQVATLSSRLAEEEGGLRAVPRRQINVAQMERRRTALVETLGGLQRERNTADVAASTELGVTQLIRPVQVPREPSGPGLPVHMGLGGALGFLLGLALAAVRFRTDARAHTPDDLADSGFTVVGTIPDLGASLREGRHPVGAASIHPALVTLVHPFGPHAEAFRHLHANLYGTEHEAPHVVLVTSPASAAGTSLVAGNLAVAAAQAGRRVLLVDADLRQPAVADLLGLGDAPALGEGPTGSNLVYWSTAVPGLFAMTPRETAQSPEQMWAPHVVGALLANLRTAFDLIVIDAPPALVAADATLLAPHADAALLVAEAGRSDLDALEQVATELSGVGLTRIGAVLNRFRPGLSVGFRHTAGVRQRAHRA